METKTLTISKENWQTLTYIKLQLGMETLNDAMSYVLGSQEGKVLAKAREMTAATRRPNNGGR